MKTIIIFFLLTAAAYSQSGKVIYKYKFNGNEMTDRSPLYMTAYSDLTILQTQINNNPNSTETLFIDYSSKKTFQVAYLKSDERFMTVDSFVNYNTPEITDEYEIINGFNCRKATTVIRSNKIEIWFTKEAGIKGTPMINVGPELGLVLKIVRNGNFEVYADNVTIPAPPTDVVYLRPKFDIVDLPTYRQKITEANFTTVRIFNDEKINFGDTIINPPADEDNIMYRYSNGTVVMKKIKLPENMSGHTVFAELVERSSGDAYDRTGSCFIVPTASMLTFLRALDKGPSVLPKYIGKDKVEYQGITLTKNYEPPIELIRFITPFGVNHYNSNVTVNGIKWEDSVTYKQDVTDLLGSLQGEVWVGVFIGCYDKGGHKVSLSLKYHPDEIDQQNVPQKMYWVQSVINTLNIMEASGQEYGKIFGTDTLSVTVDVPKGLTNLKLRYISTGHGGWGGGDEFNKKMNEIFIDDELAYKFIPWRDDCGMYRKYNPASGNFPNGISSSDYSRSGWCPGSTSVPVDIPLTDLKPGKHIIKVYIPMGKPEGTSFSAWNVSAVLIGEMK